MLNGIWIGIILTSFVVSIFNGTVGHLADEFQLAVVSAVDFALKIFGPMAFWLGIMKVAEDSGLIHALTAFVKPIIRYLFPEVPDGHEAQNAISINLMANFLGVSNAATPSGIKAMECLQRLNPHPEYASDAMCMLIAVNSSSIQLLPVTALGYLVAKGAKNSTDIVFMCLLATIVSTLFAVFMCKFIQRKGYYQIVDEGVKDVSC